MHARVVIPYTFQAHFLWAARIRAIFIRSQAPGKEGGPARTTTRLAGGCGRDDVEEVDAAFAGCDLSGVGDGDDPVADDEVLREGWTIPASRCSSRSIAYCAALRASNNALYGLTLSVDVTGLFLATLSAFDAVLRPLRRVTRPDVVVCTAISPAATEASPASAPRRGSLLMGTPREAGLLMIVRSIR